MPAPNVDAARIVTVLERHQVKYVVVGGFAVELWGVAVPPTIDIDITPELSKENLSNLAAALNELEAAMRYGEESVTVPGGLTGELIEQMTVMNLSTSAGPLDLTILPAGTRGYVEMAPTLAMLKYRDVEVPTATLEDVARSKEAAGRPKDLRTLPAIHAHLRRTGRG